MAQVKGTDASSASSKKTSLLSKYAVPSTSSKKTTSSTTQTVENHFAHTYASDVESGEAKAVQSAIPNTVASTSNSTSNSNTIQVTVDASKGNKTTESTPYAAPISAKFQSLQDALLKNGYSATNISALGLQQATVEIVPNYVTATPTEDISLTKNYYPAIVGNGVDDEQGIVNNSYISIKNKEYKDGTVVVMDADGEIVTSEDDESISEDYKEQLASVKERFSAARKEYKEAKEFQELGEAGWAMATHDNASTSLFDVFVDLVHASSEVSTQGTIDSNEWLKYIEAHPEKNNAEGQKEWLSQRVSQTHVDEAYDKAADWMYGTAAVQSFQESQSVRTKVGKYQNGNAVEQDAIRKDILTNPDYSDRYRKYLAYKCISNDLDTSALQFGKLKDIWTDDEMGKLEKVLGSVEAVAGSGVTDAVLKDILPTFGDVVDVASGQLFLKATVDYVADQLGYDIMDNTSDNSQGNLMDYYAAGLQASWQNEGRAKYNFDTGYIPLDLVLEMCTDVGNLANIAKGISDAAGASKLSKAILDEGGYVGGAAGKAIKKYVKGNIDKEALLKFVTKDLLPAEADAVANVVKSVDTYKVAYTISKSLKSVSDINDTITRSCLQLVTLSPVWKPIVANAFNATTDGLGYVLETANKNLPKISAKAKAMTDAVAEACAKNKAQPNLSVDNVQELMDMTNKNIAGLKLSGETLDFLSQDDKMLYISSAYKYEMDALQKSFTTGGINEASYTAATEKLKVDTLKVLEQNDLGFSSLASALEGTSRPSYAILSAEAKQWAIDSDNVVRTFINETDMNTAIRDTLGDTLDVQKLMSDNMETVYVAKLNERTITESIMADNDLAGMLGVGTSKVAGVQEIINTNAATATVTTKGTALTKAIDAKRAAARNYVTMRDGILNSRVIPESLKDMMVDHMVSPGFKGYVSTTFAAGTININPSQITTRAYNMARKLVNESLGLDVAFKRLNKYIDLKCNTRNASLNCDNMLNVLRGTDDEFNSVLKEAYGIDLKDTDAINVVYSFEVDANEELTRLVFKSTDGKFVLDCNTNSDLRMLDAKLLKLRSEASHAGQKVNFFGFNTKASTFDSDEMVTRWLRLHRSQTANILRGSTDIADVKRAVEFGVPIIRDEVYQDTAKYFEKSINNWLIDGVLRDAIGDKQAFSISGLDLDDLRHFQDILNDSSYVGIVSDAEQNYLDRMSKAINDKLDELEEAHLKLTNGVGFRKYNATLMEDLRQLGPDVGASKVYEYATIDKFFDTTTMSVADGIHVYKTAKQMESISNSITEHGMLVHFKSDINAAWSYVINNGAEYINPKLIDMGILDAEGNFLLRCNSLEDKVAAMQLIYNNSSHSSSIIWSVAHRRPQFFDALATPYTTYCTPTKKYYVADPVLNGSVDNRYSSWNLANETYKVAKEIDDHIADQAWVREYRIANGINSELDVVRAKYMHELQKPYNELIDYIKSDASAKEIDSVEETTSGVKRSHNNAANKYEDYMLNTVKKASSYDDLGKAMYVYDTVQAHNTLAYLVALNDDEFVNYLRQCNGRLVVDGNYINAYTVNKFIESLTARKLPDSINIEYNDETKLCRIWGDLHPDNVTQISPNLDSITSRDIEELVSELKLDYMDEVSKLHSFKKALSSFNDKSFTYGLPVSNERGTREWIVNKYFSDVADQFDLANERTVGDYYCGYIGSIKGMLGEGSFVSGDYLTNLVNSYNRTIRKMDNMDIMKDCVLRTNEVTLAVGNNISDVRTFMKGLEEEGCVVVGFDNLQGCFKQMKSAGSILAADKCAIMRADEAAALIAHSVETCEPNALIKALNGVRYLESKFYLQFMLFTGIGTGIKNWTDSTLKGWLTNGEGYGSYMLESARLQKDATPVMAYLNKRFADDITGATIDRLVDTGEWAKICAERGFNIDGDRLKMLYQFGTSTVTDWRFGDVMKKGLIDETLVDWFRDIKAGATNKNWARKLIDTPTALAMNPMFRFNSRLFQGAEMTNRLAIFLKQMDETGNVAKAYKSVAESQFDYAMTKGTKALNTVRPFVTFQLKNYGFWLKNVWNYEDAAHKIRQIARLYDYGPDEYQERYWSPEMLRLRTWIDSCNFDDDDSFNTVTDYNQFEDFQGSNLKTAKQYGWVRFTDHLYYKMGLSWMDATDGIEGFISPSGWIEDMWKPMQVCYDFAVGNDTPAVNGLKALISGDIDFTKTEDMEAWYNEYGFDTTSLLPVIGTLAYTIATGTRNGLWWNRLMEDGSVSDSMKYIVQFVMSTTVPSLFAPKKQIVDGEYYIDRAIGYNWYSQSDEYKQTHRYVPFVSYMPTWVTKDPATYINTLGRFKQLLGDNYSNEEILKLMDAGLFWGWNDDGQVVLKTWLDDDIAFENLIAQLAKFGWSREDAMDLIASTSKYWKLKIEYGDDWYKHWNGEYNYSGSKWVKYTDEQWDGIWNHVWRGCNTKDEAWSYLKSLGFSDEKIAKWLAKWRRFTPRQRRAYSRRSYRPYRKYSKKKYTFKNYKKNIVYVGYNKYQPKMKSYRFSHPKKVYGNKYSGAWNKGNYHPKMYTLSGRVSQGKNGRFSIFRNGQTNTNTRTFQFAHRWHHRQRDIYKDNYAKYGASRMKMMQNPRMYTNRSIVEMYRTDQNIRYSKLHRHINW